MVNIWLSGMCGRMFQAARLHVQNRASSAYNVTGRRVGDRRFKLKGRKAQGLK